MCSWCQRHLLPGQLKHFNVRADKLALTRLLQSVEDDRMDGMRHAISEADYALPNCQADAESTANQGAAQGGRF